MNILLLGANGSMGRRYQSILNYLRLPFTALDIMQDDFVLELHGAWESCTHVIIATPTHTHVQYIMIAARWKLRILCEKPICFSSKEIESIFEYYPDIDLSMMMQYSLVLSAQPQLSQRPQSSYSYYNHGKDGLAWDCTQIIALHNGSVGHISLSANSPIWHAKINGETISVASMDGAYFEFVERWVGNDKDQNRLPSMSMGHGLIETHRKVEDYIKYAKDYNRDTGKID